MKLSNILKIKYGKNQKNVLDENGQYPIYGTGGIFGYANSFLYNKPSVLIGRKGTINNPFYVDKPFWTVDTLFYTEINDSIVMPKWLYYKFLTINFLRFNEGTTIPSLTTKTLNDLEIKVPSIAVQQHIVDTIVLL